MAAIGTGWVDGAWIEAGWASGAWASGGDVTAPSLSSAAGSAAGATNANGSVSTDEGSGTLYWVVTESATTPSVAQIQAGQDHLGGAADDAGSQAVSATGSQNVFAGGLTASTTYYFHFQQEDAATNDSTAVSSASFNTTAAGSTPDTRSRRSRRGRSPFSA